MSVETERKYLVRKDLWYAQIKPSGKPILQGYIFSDETKTVRVRIYGDEAFLTVKGPLEGISRMEFEYPIPVADARVMLEKLSGNIIDKVRYLIAYEGHTWEIDEFFGDNEGLVIAEIELKNPDEEFAIPPWMGEEVTSDTRYSNSCLAEKPFSTWE